MQQDFVDEPRSWLGRARLAPLTAAIVGLCVLAFATTVGLCAVQHEDPARIGLEALYGLGSCRTEMEELGSLALARVWVDREWWRVVTMGLLHGSLVHLLLNIWSLWSVGRWCESTWGSARTALLFLGASIAGGFGSLMWAEAPVVVGASAGVLGLAGALLVGRLVGDAETQHKLQQVSAVGLGVTLVVLFVVGAIVPVIAQAGHVGGFAFGVIACWAGLQKSWMRLAVVLALGVGSREVLRIAGQPDGRPNYHEFVGFRYLELGRDDEGLEAMERALKMSPGDPQISNAVAYGLALAGRDFDRAVELVDVALADDPENGNYVDTKGWIACRRGLVAEGMALLEQAQALSDVPVEEIEGHLRDCVSAGVPRETP